MSEEFRKRVADAIFNQYRPYFNHDLAEQIAGYAARAALEAMREPTPRMISEGESAASFGIGKCNDEEALPRVWHAMIDEAKR